MRRVRVSSTVTIASDPRSVWDFIADPENGPRWQEGAVSTRMTTPGPVRLGSAMEHVGRWLGMRLRTHAIVTVFDPPSAFGYDITSSMSRSPSLMRYTLEAVPEGTRLTLSNEWTLPWFMGPFGSLLRRSVQRMFDRDVRRLRDVLTRDWRSPREDVDRPA